MQCGKEKEWVDCEQRKFDIAGEWKVTALEVGVWVERVLKAGLWLMAARRQEADAARLRQDKREANTHY